MDKNKKKLNKLLSVFTVLTMVTVALAVPLISSDSSSATSSSTWMYTISITGNTSSVAVSISGVTDGNGNSTSNLTSTDVGSWGWDSNSEYGPFGSYYAAFDSNGKVICHVRADNLTKAVGTGATVDSSYNIMWVLPTVYWNVDSSGNLILSNDPSKGTAYAHTIDGKVYNYLAIGVYETHTVNNKAQSLSNVSPTVDMSRPGFRTASEYTIDADGDSTADGYSMQWNYYQWALYKYCVFATLGTFDSQSFAGGPTGNSASSTTGLTNVSDTAMPSGYYTKGASDTNSSVRLFLENAWGSLYEWVDNTYVNSYVWYVGQTHNASDNSTDKTNIGTMPSKDGYVSAINTADNNWGLPSVISGSSTTGTCDYYVYNSGERSVYVGGIWSRGSGAGVSYVAADSSLGYSHSSVGARLSFVFDADSASGYTVTYNPNGGELSVTSVKVGKGETTVLPTPTREEWTFDGWYEDSRKVGDAGKTITVTANMTLTAHWTEKMINLTFYYNLDNPASGNPIYKVISVKINTSPSELMPSDPTEYGLNFGGWYNEKDTATAFDPSAVVTVDKSVYAKWENTLKITSVPTIECISHNTYSMSITLEDGQTAVWYDSENNEIGKGTDIKYKFQESGTHTGYIKIYNSDGTSVGDAEWSVTVPTDGGINITHIIAVVLIVIAVGILAVRRF